MIGYEDQGFADLCDADHLDTVVITAMGHAFPANPRGGVTATPADVARVGSTNNLGGPDGRVRHDDPGGTRQ